MSSESSDPLCEARVAPYLVRFTCLAMFTLRPTIIAWSRPALVVAYIVTVPLPSPLISHFWFPRSGARALIGFG